MTPADIDIDLWARLNACASSRDGGLRLPVLCTVDRSGRPHARTVVLRGVDTAVRHLFFHTDQRSPKMDDLRHRSAVAVCFYDHPTQIQIRVEGVATVHVDDALANDRWNSAVPATLKCYAQSVAPSQELADPGLLQWTESGRSNFAVIRVEATEVDWLSLDPAGHRRCRFSASDGWTGRWVAP
jgi:pyridoxamine 5'-phosphate oxidase